MQKDLEALYFVLKLFKYLFPGILGVTGKAEQPSRAAPLDGIH